MGVICSCFVRWGFGVYTVGHGIVRKWHQRLCRRRAAVPSSSHCDVHSPPNRWPMRMSQKYNLGSRQEGASRGVMGIWVRKTCMMILPPTYKNKITGTRKLTASLPVYTCCQVGSWGGSLWYKQSVLHSSLSNLPKSLKNRMLGV